MDRYLSYLALMKELCYGFATDDAQNDTIARTIKYESLKKKWNSLKNFDPSLPLKYESPKIRRKILIASKF